MNKVYKICPKCKSLDVKVDDRKGLSFIGGISPEYKCNNCNFTSILFPEVDYNKIEKFRNKIKKSEGKKR